MGVIGRIIGAVLRSDTLQISPEILSLIARIDEFKGAWRALGLLAPDRLSALRRVATIESIGSSTRIEGSQLTDREVEKLLSNLAIQSFETCVRISANVTGDFGNVTGLRSGAGLRREDCRDGCFLPVFDVS